MNFHSDRASSATHTQKAEKQINMASGLFGLPITEDTVRATGEYPEPITQRHVADYAMKMKNASGKDLEAQDFVDNLKKRFVYINK
jgi:uncharacterized protein YvpB